MLPFLGRFFYQIWYALVDSFCHKQEQVLSVTQPGVIYIDARNLTFVFDEFAQNALERWFTGEIFASCKKSGPLNPFLVINLQTEVK